MPASYEQHKEYFDELLKLMNFLDHPVVYNRKTIFSQDQLLQITDVDVGKYFLQYTYGKQTVGEDDHAKKRLNTLKWKKKALSFFMPRKNVVWDCVRNEGNPTRSVLMDKFLDKLQTKQTRKQAPSPKARRIF